MGCVRYLAYMMISLIDWFVILACAWSLDLDLRYTYRMSYDLCCLFLALFDTQE